MVDAAHDAIQTQKTAIRRIALARRDAMPGVACRESDRIATMALDYLDERLTHPDGDGEQDTPAAAPCPTPPSKTPIVAAFWSFGSEVDTRPIIAGIHARGWRLALPCMVRTSQTHPSQRTVATMRFPGGSRPPARRGGLPVRRETHPFAQRG